MFKFEKIKDKSIAKVMAQDSQPCKYAGHRGAYNCLYDCKKHNKARYYKSKDL